MSGVSAGGFEPPGFATELTATIDPLLINSISANWTTETLGSRNTVGVNLNMQTTVVMLVVWVVDTVVVLVAVIAVWVLVAVVLVSVALTVVMVAVTTLISGTETDNDDSSICKPSDWKLAARDDENVDVSLAIWCVVSKIPVA
jgi:hypothetical protein